MAMQAPNEAMKAELMSANEALDARLRAERTQKWERIWAASGIKYAGPSIEHTMGDMRAMEGPPDGMVIGADAGLEIGDVVALYEGDVPNRLNQCVCRVTGLGEPAETGNRMVEFGTMLPRAEWPDAMREATAPTTLYVQAAVGMSGFSINLMGDGGRIVGRYFPGDEESLAQEGYLEAVIEDSSDLGMADGLEGRRRTFEIIKGNGDHGRMWQIVDNAGNAKDIERRNLLQRRPPEFVQAVLLATSAAYAEGMTEALDKKNALDAEPAAPSMGMGA